MDLINQITNYLNANQPVVIGIASVIGICAQYALNRFVGLEKLTNRILGIVAIPGVVTALASYGTSLHLSAYPWVAIVGQVLYGVWEHVKANVSTKAVAAVTPPPAEY